MDDVDVRRDGLQPSLLLRVASVDGEVAGT